MNINCSSCVLIEEIFDSVMMWCGGFYRCGIV